MPHKCNTCGTVYPDGCEDILKGCTDCGNKKFEYIPERSVTTQKENTEPDLKPIVSENESQAKARTDIVDKSELPDKTSTPEHNSPEEENLLNPEQPQIESILNDQFEGITVLEKGKYELNLSELFSGESKIIKIQEDGKYVVDVAETFKGL